jgi:hypothetical protein
MMRTLLILPAICAVAALSACNPATLGSNKTADVVGFHQMRLSDLQTINDFESCVEEGISRDSMARDNGDPAQFLSSAEILEGCEYHVIDGTHLVPEDQRMKVYALSIQNYFIGGDVTKAKMNLEKFRTTFQGKDLIYADGTSFTDTYDVLFSYTHSDKKSLLNLASMNAKPSVKDEVRRVWYWENN